MTPNNITVKFTYLKCNIKKMIMLSNDPFLKQYLLSAYNVPGPVLSQKKIIFGFC